MNRQGVLNGLLSLIVLAISIKIVLVWRQQLSPIPIAPRHLSIRSKANDNLPNVPPDITDDDLFDESRKPPPKSEAIESAPADDQLPTDLVLIGVQIIGRDREAFVSEGGIAKRLRVGDMVSDYLVTAIKAAGVQFTSSTGRIISLGLLLAQKTSTSTESPAEPGQCWISNETGTPMWGPCPTVDMPGLVTGGEPIGFVETAPDTNLIRNIPTIEIRGDGDEPILTIAYDGQVTFGKDYTPTKAARIFWKAIGRNAPCHHKSIKKVVQPIT